MCVCVSMCIIRFSVSMCMCKRKRMCMLCTHRYVFVCIHVHPQVCVSVQVRECVWQCSLQVLCVYVCAPGCLHVIMSLWVCIYIYLSVLAHVCMCSDGFGDSNLIWSSNLFDPFQTFCGWTSRHGLDYAHDHDDAFIDLSCIQGRSLMHLYLFMCLLTWFIFYSKQMFIMVIFGLIVGTVYFQIGDSKTDGIQNRSVQCKCPTRSHQHTLCISDYTLVLTPETGIRFAHTDFSH